MTSKFEQAFSYARSSGKKEFSYGGKSYNTKLAPSTPKMGPVPQSRQGQDKGSGGRPSAIPGHDVQMKQSTPPSKPVGKGPAGVDRYNQGSSTVRYKRDDSFASKATAFVADVTNNGLAEAVSKRVGGSKSPPKSGGGGW